MSGRCPSVRACACPPLRWMHVDVAAVSQCVSVSVPDSLGGGQTPLQKPHCAASAEFLTWSDRFPDLPL